MYLLDIALTGLAAVRLHPLRSLVSVAALVVVLTPYLAGLALARGLEAQAEESARQGADLVVSGRQFGRPVALPVESAGRVARLEGVDRAVPRIVGEVFLGREQIPAVLVGLPAEHFPEWADDVRGELPRDGGPNELVIGTSLARRLSLDVGHTLPPFYRNDRGERLSRVVGVFRADAPRWQAHLILTTFDTAAHIFDQQGLATDVLVWCRPGYQAEVARAVARDLSFRGTEGRGVIRAGVTSREELLATLPQGTLRREGVFTMHFVLAFVAGILVLLVTSGLGLAERRREIGVLKACGWQTDEVLLRAAVESLCLGLAGACVALILAWAWLRLFNGWGIAGFYLGAESIDFRVPFRLAPVPALLGFVLSAVVVFTGTLFSSWRAATTPPFEAMR